MPFVQVAELTVVLPFHRVGLPHSKRMICVSLFHSFNQGLWQGAGEQGCRHTFPSRPQRGGGGNSKLKSPGGRVSALARHF